MALTAAQQTDARRHLGYGVVGTTQTISANGDVVYLVFGMRQMSLYERLNTLTATEEAVVAPSLTSLNNLEAAILTAGDNLDTDKAAVWTRNRSEIRDRERLYNNTRLRFAALLGCPPGPGLAGAGTISIGRA